MCVRACVENNFIEFCIYFSLSMGLIEGKVQIHNVLLILAGRDFTFIIHLKNVVIGNILRKCKKYFLLICLCNLWVEL